MLRALGFCALLVAGCTPSAPSNGLGSALPYLTKDDILVVDGRHLSLDGYSAVTREMASPHSEATLQIAITALGLQARAASLGRELAPAFALEIARMAEGNLPFNAQSNAVQTFGSLFAPMATQPELQARIEKELKGSVILRNPAILQELAQKTPANGH